MLQARLLSVLLLIHLGLFAGRESLVLQSGAGTRVFDHRQSPQSPAFVLDGAAILVEVNEQWDNATGSSDPLWPPSLSTQKPHGFRSSQQNAKRLLHIARYPPCAAPQTGPPILHATA